MAQQLINVGNAPNDQTGDTLRAGCQKTNANFSELYGLTGSIQTVANSALNTAQDAQTDATSAVNVANAASTAATNAQNTANSAQTDATQALQDAAAAQLDATQALQDAAAAQLDATQALQDAASAQATADAALPLAGGTMSGSINMDGQTITNLPEPVAAQEPATKNYVDSLDLTAAADILLPSYTDGWAYEVFEDYPSGAISVVNGGFGWYDNGIISGGSIVTHSVNNGSYSRKALQLSNGEYLRKLPWGDAWHRMLIAVMFRTNAPAANFTNTAGFIGICSGTANPVTSATTANFFGTRFDPTVNIWSHNVGTVADYFTQATGTRLVTKRGAVITDRGSGSGSDGRAFARTEGFYSIFTLEISRVLFASDVASINYSSAMRSTSNTVVQFPMTRANMFDVVREPAAASLGQLGQVQISGGTVTFTTFAFDQSTGKFDTLDIAWANTTEKMEIAALCVRKMN